MKENNYTECPNCGESLKSGFKSNSLLSETAAALINEYSNSKSDYYCDKCGKEPLKEAKKRLSDEMSKLNSTLRSNISEIPVISTHHPYNWEYEVKGMVTGQSTTGTGVITEFTSDFSDIFGGQSGRHNKKIKAGEDLCFAQLQKQTIDMGANAVIATDIDYSEVGSQRGMLMVCMAGTAVRLENTAVLGENKAEKINEIVRVNERLSKLLPYKGL